MIWDPVFGWDWDRIRFFFGFTIFIVLFSGFVSATEGGSFFDPLNIAFSFVQSHDIEFLIGTLIFSMAVFQIIDYLRQFIIYFNPKLHLQYLIQNKLLILNLLY